MRGRALRRALVACTAAVACSFGAGAAPPLEGCVSLAPIGESDKPLPSLLVCPEAAARDSARAGGGEASTIRVVAAAAVVDGVCADVRRLAADRPPAPPAYGTFAARCPGAGAPTRYLARRAAADVVERLLSALPAAHPERARLAALARRLR